MDRFHQEQRGYPSNHSYSGYSETEVAPDYDDGPQDFGVGQSSRQPARHSRRGFISNRIEPYNSYDSQSYHEREGSGDYDNRDEPVVNYFGEMSGYRAGYASNCDGGFQNEGFQDEGLRRRNEGEMRSRKEGERRYKQQRSRDSNRHSGEYDHHRYSRGHPNDDDEDNISVSTIDLSNNKNQIAWNVLHTIKLRRKSHKSRKSSRRHRGDSESDDDGDMNENEETVLPSLQIRHKPKTLHERLQEAREKDSVHDIADALRDAFKQSAAGGVASVKQSINKTWQKNKAQLKGWLYQLELWASTFKEIEGRFGMATVSYFRFTRWLMFLNFYIFIIMFCVIVIPYWALPRPESFLTYANKVQPQDKTYYLKEAFNCSEEYAVYIDNSTRQESVAEKVLDFIQGTGWMERTELFYGVYHNKSYDTADSADPGTYNMSLAYLLATGICFLISFLLIVKNSGKSVKEAVTDRESTTTMYCNKVFSGWDFCIANEKGARRKHDSLWYEIKADLEEQRQMLQRAARSTREKCKLYTMRFFINLFVLAILGACLYLIYWTTERLLELQKKPMTQIVALIVQYLPSLTITILNFIIPLMFSKVVIAEDYSPAFQLKITLFRTVLLRLASLGVLIISLYIQLLSAGEKQCKEEEGMMCCGNNQWQSSDSTNNNKGNIKCWETYVGQQFYKLALLDFIAIVLLTFLVEFPRKLVYDHYHNRFKLVRLVGQQEFDLPKNVLDIVYSQTLCWLGMFFSPLIPAITLAKCFIIFYVKKVTLLRNCIPPVRPYRASRSNSFFMTVLLFSFVLAVLPLGYLTGNVKPSQSCGPFRVYSSAEPAIFDTITNTVRTWPSVARDIFVFLGTVGFFVPAIILLCLLMYYYWAAAQGYKKMEELLKEQLKLEGKDRQFLLARVNDVIQRGELGTAAHG